MIWDLAFTVLVNQLLKYNGKGEQKAPFFSGGECVKGLGNDIVDVRRIEKLLSKSYGPEFLERVFTQEEIAYCMGRANAAQSFAARWALKEAFYKAIPEKFQRLSTWKSIELQNRGGKPQVCILDDTLKNELATDEITQVFHSVSHEKNYCTAVVVLD